MAHRNKYSKNPNVPASLRPYYQQVARGIGWGFVKSVNPFIDNYLDTRCYGNVFNPENYKLRLSSLETKIKERIAICLDLAYLLAILGGAGYLIYQGAKHLI